MNGNYFQNPTFPTERISTDTEPSYNEQSYIENILRLNKGKRVNAYVSFPDSSEWKNKKFSGIIEEAGSDHLIISDPETGYWYLIRIIYLDYVEFMEKVNYNHAYSEKNFNG